LTPKNEAFIGIDKQMKPITVPSKILIDENELNADFTVRALLRPADLPWQSTAMKGIEFKLLEACVAPYPRRTLLLKCEPGSDITQYEQYSEVEFIVLEGSVSDDKNQYSVGTYVRNPLGTSQAHSKLGCVLFVKLSQIHIQDQGSRTIDTTDSSQWLPGLVDHTQVYPLHMWETECVLLMRWDKQARFKPSIAPQGEEILVIQGELRDHTGVFPTGSWIRNPVKTWQSWEGSAGTLIYYKRGHLPDVSLTN
jgi:hypothetical protein